MSLYDEVAALFAERGDEEYHGEPVSQTEHALQTAHFAAQAGHSDAVVVASLLHDIGHLLHTEGEDAAEHGIDTHHEVLGERWLAERFGPEIAEPARLHVEAKRYLCATDAAYRAGLSPASQLSLELQGGPMSAEEVTAFEQNPYFREAVALRRCDDQGKIPGLEVPPLSHYRDLIEGFALTRV